MLRKSFDIYIYESETPVYKNGSNNITILYKKLELGNCCNNMIDCSRACLSCPWRWRLTNDCCWSWGGSCIPGFLLVIGKIRCNFGSSLSNSSPLTPFSLAWSNDILIRLKRVRRRVLTRGQTPHIFLTEQHTPPVFLEESPPMNQKTISDHLKAIQYHITLNFGVAQLPSLERTKVYPAEQELRIA